MGQARSGFLQLEDLYVWPEPDGERIAVGSRAAAFEATRSPGSLAANNPPLVPRPLPDVTWALDRTYALEANCRPVHMRIQDHRSAERVALLLADLEDHRPPQCDLAFAETAEGFQGLWRAGRCEQVDTAVRDPLRSRINPLMSFIQHSFPVGDLAALVHGAMIQFAGEGIALLGRSAAGKSTLATYLTSQGASLVSDEVIPVLADRTVARVRARPSLQQGAWSMLQPIFPALADVPTLVRHTKLYRLLATSRFTAQPRTPVTRIVFVQFQPSAETVMIPIGLDEAVLRLRGSGFWVAPEGLPPLIEAVRGASAHVLTYSQLPSATRCLRTFGLTATTV